MVLSANVVGAGIFMMAKASQSHISYSSTSAPIKPMATMYRRLEAALVEPNFSLEMCTALGSGLALVKGKLV